MERGGIADPAPGAANETNKMGALQSAGERIQLESLIAKCLDIRYCPSFASQLTANN
jgi:hypothetical protein